MNTIALKFVFFVVLTGFSQFAVADDARVKNVHFPAGESGTIIKDRITGYETVNYKLGAKAGQSMVVDLKSDNGSNYFNIFAPGTAPGDAAMYISSTQGNHYTGTLPADGEYTVQVYLYRNAARRNDSANFSLDIGITGAAKASQSQTLFDETYQLHGISFHVTSSRDDAINTLRITPAGLEIDNAVIKREIDGSVTGAEVGDLNADGSPEIYVYVTSAGSGSYGTLVAYSANNKKSLSEIYLPPVTDNKTISAGYMGHDEFTLLENVLGQRFPIYLDKDSNAHPTGGMRQLQYRLVAGEAGWILKLDKTTDISNIKEQVK